MAEMSRALARVVREPFADVPIADHVNQLLKESKHVRRVRVLPQLVTLRLFVLQVLNGNCAIAALRHLVGFNFAPSSYCEARERLPLQLLQSLPGWLRDHAEQSLGAGPRLLGPRVFIADGSSYSMPDTPALRAHFRLPPGVKEGVGYPMGKIMGLLDAATGMFVSLLAAPLFEHDMRSVIGAHATLLAGDILLGDRALCSFAHIALLNAKSVFCCLRLHQRRKDTSRGRQQWKKQSRPAWMTVEQFQSLPASVDVRLVCYYAEQKGFRTQKVFIATTLLDEVEWPDARVAELYGKRWQIETCFGHLKTTMKMNVLKCGSVDGVMKELAVYLVVYNLVRLAMLKAAKAQGVCVTQVSFIDAMRMLREKIRGLESVDRLIINPYRPGRSQLRVVRRRPKSHSLLTVPRREMERKTAEKTAKAA